MAISVISSNFNGARWLPRLLETLEGQRGVELEIIVVDRNSTDDSHAILARHPRVRVISEPPESGLVAGYAKAVPHARHDYLFFCNEDMWFEPDCLKLVRDQFDVPNAGRVGAVMPLQRTYDGSALVAGGTWYTPTRWWRHNAYPFRESVIKPVSEPETLSCINAGACMVSREAYDEIGGWDPTFFLDHEDTDLSLRLWQHGFSCRIEPRAIVYHAVGATNQKRVHNGRLQVGRKRYVAQFSNQVVIAMKTFTGLAPLVVPALVLDRMARDLVKGRLDWLGMDVASAWLTLRRLPEVLEYRRKARDVNRRRPGQDFFRDENFNVPRP